MTDLQVMRTDRGVRAHAIPCAAIVGLPWTVKGAAHGISLSRSALSFDTIRIGSSSRPQGFTITNTGSAPLSIYSIQAFGDFSQKTNCGSSVRKRGECTVSVTFAPTEAGSRSGAITISDNAPGSPHVVALAGTGFGSEGIPQILVSPSSLDVGNVNLQSTGTAVITLSNPGSAPVALGSISTSGDFGQSNDCGSSIAVGDRCSVNVTFTPTVIGSRNGSLTVTDNAVGSPQSVALQGVGVGIATAVLSASYLDFGNQSVGTQSSPRPVLLSNTGTAPLQLSGITANGNFAETNGCGSTLDVGASCTISVTAKPTSTGVNPGTIVVADNAPGAPHSVSLTSNGVTASNDNNSSNISAVWANEGGDKVTRDELRATNHVENLTGTVINRAWNGSTILLSGARNEVVSFNLVLEAANARADNVTVKFDTLTGPGGAIISSAPASGNGVFNWVGRPIELFYVRYLQIKGLSYFGYGKGDERQIPVRFQTPWSGNGVGTGVWTDRPDHDQFYPDIMVPLELEPAFSIAPGQNQSIWADVYIPKNVPSGLYTGTVTVLENGTATHRVPVSVTVQTFTLPDTPSSKTLVNLDTTDVMWRYVTGYGGYANWASADGSRIAAITDKYFELFHRHKIGLTGENECPVADRPCDTGIPRLNGNLYTPAHGYDGPGVNTPEGVFSIGTYGTWGAATYGVPGWKYDRNLFWNHIDNYSSWFQQNLPGADYFLYLADEPSRSDFNQIETWSQWIAQDPGPGRNMLSMATVDAVYAQTYMPTLDIPVTAAGIGTCLNTAPCDPAANMQDAASFYRNTPGRRFWNYNDGRPGTGTSMTEDDGISMRVLPWTQYKMGIDRWFYWYANLNAPTDWFQNAVTWGSTSYYDQSLGEYGTNGTSNGNGLLVYPGTDVGNPADSYGVDGPFASLRLKEWRRGIQDTDYLALANQIDPVATAAIVNGAVPKALWENPAPGGDPSYFIGPISWSSNPDDWEAKRAQLSQIINSYCSSNPAAGFCNGN